MLTDQAHVVHLSEAVSPPEDGIITRTVFQDEHLKAVMFGFGAGQELSEHSTPRRAIMHFLSGEADVTAGGKPVQATAGTWIHMAPGLAHSVVAKSPTVMLLLMFKPAT
jgi:quercetin dioxygenase-like cupin family protein